MLGFSIKDKIGQTIFGTNTWHTKQSLFLLSHGKSYLFRIKLQANFGEGNYSLQLALVDKDTHLSANYEWRDMALIFRVINNKVPFVGSMWSEPFIKIKELD